MVITVGIYGYRDEYICSPQRTQMPVGTMVQKPLRRWGMNFFAAFRKLFVVFHGRLVFNLYL